MLKNWLNADWPAPANVHAATTLRLGGVSEGCYSSFNLASHVGDDPERVQQNRALLKRQLALPSDPVWLEQVHGHTVVQADLVCGVLPADASFTAKAKVVCAVMTADCLPVVFCSADGTTVAATHAGWRGLLAGVLSETCKAMQQTDIMAWLGPAISPERFEVGPEVKAAFVAKNAEFATAFVQSDELHYLADIYQLARIELSTCGISHVYGGGFCTVTDVERFFSYRRESKTGRMATLIWRE
jgi:polyphenol oxidase